MPPPQTIHPSGSHLLHHQHQFPQQEIAEAYDYGLVERKEEEKHCNGVRVRLQRSRLQQGEEVQQGEEATAQEGPTQASDSQDPIGHPHGTGRKKQVLWLRKYKRAGIMLVVAAI